MTVTAESIPARQTWMEKLRAEVGDDAPMARAADRCTFALTYGRTEPRQMLGNTLDGPDIPDAYDEYDRQSSEWFDGDDPTTYDRDTEDEWVDFYAGMAVKEAVHEALEWFKVDGEPWLDPHGTHEREIHQLAAEFASRLSKLRAAERAS